MWRARQGLILAALAGVACGSPSAPDGGSGDGGFQTAAHQPFPLVTNFDGGVLPSVQLVTLTYPLYPHTASVQGWGDYAVGSEWIRITGGEYGVGTGSHLAKIVLPDPAPAQVTDALIQQSLFSYIAHGVIPPSPPTTNNEVLYMLYLNASTAMNDPDSGLGVLCTDFSGYHNNVGLDGGANVYYAVVGDCDAADAGEAVAAADVEATAAHELIESATDPTGNSWYLDVPISSSWWEPWEYSEIGDLCTFVPYTLESGWTFQRIWSNQAAAAGRDPCIPAPADAGYWNVSPAPASVQVVSPGQSIQITLTGWSSVPVPSWPLTVGPDVFPDDFDPVASVSELSLANGATATLTLSVPADAGSGLYGTVFVYSDANQDDGWPVTIQTP
jgi:hypothetical protein